MCKPIVSKPTVSLEVEPKSHQALPASQDYPSADEGEKPIADWKGYSLETLLALDE